MKSIFKTVLYLGALLAAASCVLDQIDSQPTPAPRLDCDALESYTIQANIPQDISFRVSSNTPWTITGFENEEWISVSPVSSAVSSLSEDIRIQTVVNPDALDRSVTLSIQSENSDLIRKVLITQLRQPSLVVIPIADTELLPVAGGTKDFQLETNIDWEAKAADPWLSLNPAKGSTDGSIQSFTVSATAEANSSIKRSTTVTVTAADQKFEFLVRQNGQSLEFVGIDETTELDRRGGELMIDVDATMDWKVECDNTEFSAEKVGNDKIKLSIPWNKYFKERKIKLTIKPAASADESISRSVELKQGINFSFSGNCEVQSDGSVKIYTDKVSKVSTLDDFRYVSIVLTMGQVAFGEKARMWCAVNADGCNIYSQIGLGDNVRLRQDGSLTVTHKPNGDAVSTYQNVSLNGIDKAALNAMKEYRFEVLPQLSADPDYPGVWWHVVNFWYNGVLNTTLNYRSVFADNPEAAGKYWFGTDKATTDGTWYIVKSCELTVL